MGLVAYQPTLVSMKAFTAGRTATTEDEIWLLQHPPVYTQGLSGKPEHVLDPGDIPVVQIDRGGQVTYHGPGQWVAYILYDLRRAGVNVRELVTLLEIAVINLLAELDKLKPSKIFNSFAIGLLFGVAVFSLHLRIV